MSLESEIIGADAMNLEQAESIHAGLRKKLDDARLSLAALDECRKEIAFAAHTGDSEAEKRLTKSAIPLSRKAPPERSARGFLMCENQEFCR